jgi:hypothetical protein
MVDAINGTPMKTLCVGRFLLDVPTRAVVSYGGSTLSGWDFSSNSDETDIEFNTRLQARENQLRQEKNEHDGQSLEVVREIRQARLYGKIFMFNREWLDGFVGEQRTIDETVNIEASARVDGISYNFRAALKFPTDIDKLEGIIRRIHWLGTATIPNDAGFCFGHGMIEGLSNADQAEFTVMFVGLKDHPDLTIALSSAAGINPGKSLISRYEENPIDLLYRWRFHSVRQGQRALNGIPGEEHLERVHEENGSNVHGFMWESHGTNSDVYLPVLSLEFDTGHGKSGRPVDSSLSDSEALALWDKISSSLRRRPIAPAKAVVVPPSKLVADPTTKDS